MSTADVLRSVRSLPSQLNDNRVVTEHELETTHHRLVAELQSIGKVAPLSPLLDTSCDPVSPRNRPYVKPPKAETVNGTVFDPAFSEYDDALTFGIAVPAPSGSPTPSPTSVSPHGHSRKPSRLQTPAPVMSALPPHVPVPSVLPSLTNLQKLPPLLLAHLSRPVSSLDGSHVTVTPNPTNNNANINAASTSSTLSTHTSSASAPLLASLPPSPLQALLLLRPALRSPTPHALWRAVLDMYRARQPRMLAARHMLLARLTTQMQIDTRTGHHHTAGDHFYGSGTRQGLVPSRTPLSTLYAHGLADSSNPYRDAPALPAVLAQGAVAVSALARAVDAVEQEERVGAARLGLLACEESERAWAAGARDRVEGGGERDRGNDAPSGGRSAGSYGSDGAVGVSATRVAQGRGGATGSLVPSSSVASLASTAMSASASASAADHAGAVEHDATPRPHERLVSDADTQRLVSHAINTQRTQKMMQAGVTAAKYSAYITAVHCSESQAAAERAWLEGLEVKPAVAAAVLASVSGADSSATTGAPPGTSPGTASTADVHCGRTTAPPTPDSAAASQWLQLLQPAVMRAPPSTLHPLYPLPARTDTATAGVAAAPSLSSIGAGSGGRSGSGADVGALSVPAEVPATSTGVHTPLQSGANGERTSNAATSMSTLASLLAGAPRRRDTAQRSSLFGDAACVRAGQRATGGNRDAGDAGSPALLPGNPASQSTPSIIPIASEHSRRELMRAVQVAAHVPPLLHSISAIEDATLHLAAAFRATNMRLPGSRGGKGTSGISVFDHSEMDDDTDDELEVYAGNRDSLRMSGKMNLGNTGHSGDKWARFPLPPLSAPENPQSLGFTHPKPDFPAYARRTLTYAQHWMAVMHAHTPAILNTLTRCTDLWRWPNSSSLADGFDAGTGARAADSLSATLTSLLPARPVVVESALPHTPLFLPPQDEAVSAFHAQLDELCPPRTLLARTQAARDISASLTCAHRAWLRNGWLQDDHMRGDALPRPSTGTRRARTRSRDMRDGDGSTGSAPLPPCGTTAPSPANAYSPHVAPSTPLSSASASPAAVDLAHPAVARARAWLQSAQDLSRVLSAMDAEAGAGVLFTALCDGFVAVDEDDVEEEAPATGEAGGDTGDDQRGHASTSDAEVTMTNKDVYASLSSGDTTVNGDGDMIGDAQRAVENLAGAYASADALVDVHGRVCSPRVAVQWCASLARVHALLIAHGAIAGSDLTAATQHLSASPSTPRGELIPPESTLPEISRSALESRLVSLYTLQALLLQHTQHQSLYLENYLASAMHNAWFIAHNAGHVTDTLAHTSSAPTSAVDAAVGHEGVAAARPASSTSLGSASALPASSLSASSIPAPGAAHDTPAPGAAHDTPAPAAVSPRASTLDHLSADDAPASGAELLRAYLVRARAHPSTNMADATAAALDSVAAGAVSGVAVSVADGVGHGGTTHVSGATAQVQLACGIAASIRALEPETTLHTQFSETHTSDATDRGSSTTSCGAVATPSAHPANPSTAPASASAQALESLLAGATTSANNQHSTAATLTSSLANLSRPSLPLDSYFTLPSGALGVRSAVLADPVVQRLACRQRRTSSTTMDGAGNSVAVGFSGVAVIGDDHDAVDGDAVASTLDIPSAQSSGGVLYADALRRHHRQRQQLVQIAGVHLRYLQARYHAHAECPNGTCGHCQSCERAQWASAMGRVLHVLVADVIAHNRACTMLSHEMQAARVRSRDVEDFNNAHTAATDRVAVRDAAVCSALGARRAYTNATVDKECSASLQARAEELRVHGAALRSDIATLNAATHPTSSTATPAHTAQADLPLSIDLASVYVCGPSWMAPFDALARPMQPWVDATSSNAAQRCLLPRTALLPAPAHAHTTATVSLPEDALPLVCYASLQALARHYGYGEGSAGSDEDNEAESVSGEQQHRIETSSAPHSKHTNGHTQAESPVCGRVSCTPVEWSWLLRLTPKQVTQLSVRVAHKAHLPRHQSTFTAGAGLHIKGDADAKDARAGKSGLRGQHDGGDGVSVDMDLCSSEDFDDQSHATSADTHSGGVFSPSSAIPAATQRQPAKEVVLRGIAAWAYALHSVFALSPLDVFCAHLLLQDARLSVSSLSSLLHSVQSHLQLQQHKKDIVDALLLALSHAVDRDAALSLCRRVSDAAQREYALELVPPPSLQVVTGAAAREDVERRRCMQAWMGYYERTEYPAGNPALSLDRHSQRENPGVHAYPSEPAAVPLATLVQAWGAHAGQPVPAIPPALCVSTGGGVHAVPAVHLLSSAPLRDALAASGLTTDTLPPQFCLPLSRRPPAPAPPRLSSPWHAMPAHCDTLRARAQTLWQWLQALAGAEGDSMLGTGLSVPCAASGRDVVGVVRVQVLTRALHTRTNNKIGRIGVSHGRDPRVARIVPVFPRWPACAHLSFDVFCPPPTLHSPLNVCLHLSPSSSRAHTAATAPIPYLPMFPASVLSPDIASTLSPDGQQHGAMWGPFAVIPRCILTPAHPYAHARGTRAPSSAATPSSADMGLPPHAVGRVSADLPHSDLDIDVDGVAIPPPNVPVALAHQWTHAARTGTHLHAVSARPCSSPSRRISRTHVAAHTCSLSRVPALTIALATAPPLDPCAPVRSVPSAHTTALVAASAARPRASASPVRSIAPAVPPRGSHALTDAHTVDDARVLFKHTNIVFSQLCVDADVPAAALQRLLDDADERGVPSPSSLVAPVSVSAAAVVEDDEGVADQHDPVLSSLLSGKPLPDVSERARLPPVPASSSVIAAQEARTLVASAVPALAARPTLHKRLIAGRAPTQLLASPLAIQPSLASLAALLDAADAADETAQMLQMPWSAPLATANPYRNSCVGRYWAWGDEGFAGCAYGETGYASSVGSAVDAAVDVEDTAAGASSATASAVSRATDTCTSATSTPTGPAPGGATLACLQRLLHSSPYSPGVSLRATDMLDCSAATSVATMLEAMLAPPTLPLHAPASALSVPSLAHPAHAWMLAHLFSQRYLAAHLLYAFLASLPGLPRTHALTRDYITAHVMPLLPPPPSAPVTTHTRCFLVPSDDTHAGEVFGASSGRTVARGGIAASVGPTGLLTSAPTHAPPRSARAPALAPTAGTSTALGSASTQSLAQDKTATTTGALLRTPATSGPPACPSAAPSLLSPRSPPERCSDSPLSWLALARLFPRDTIVAIITARNAAPDVLEHPLAPSRTYMPLPLSAATHASSPSASPSPPPPLLLALLASHCLAHTTLASSAALLDAPTPFHLPLSVPAHLPHTTASAAAALARSPSPTSADGTTLTALWADPTYASPSLALMVATLTAARTSVSHAGRPRARHIAAAATAPLPTPSPVLVLLHWLLVGRAALLKSAFESRLLHALHLRLAALVAVTDAATLMLTARVHMRNAALAPSLRKMVSSSASENSFPELRSPGQIPDATGDWSSFPPTRPSHPHSLASATTRPRLSFLALLRAAADAATSPTVLVAAHRAPLHPPAPPAPSLVAEAAQLAYTDLAGHFGPLAAHMPLLARPDAFLATQLAMADAFAGCFARDERSAGADMFGAAAGGKGAQVQAEAPVTAAVVTPASALADEAGQEANVRTHQGKRRASSLGNSKTSEGESLFPTEIDPIPPEFLQPLPELKPHAPATSALATHILDRQSPLACLRLAAGWQEVHARVLALVVHVHVSLLVACPEEANPEAHTYTHATLAGSPSAPLPMPSHSSLPTRATAAPPSSTALSDAAAASSTGRMLAATHQHAVARVATSLGLADPPLHGDGSNSADGGDVDGDAAMQGDQALLAANSLRISTSAHAANVTDTSAGIGGDTGVRTGMWSRPPPVDAAATTCSHTALMSSLCAAALALKARPFTHAAQRGLLSAFTFLSPAALKHGAWSAYKATSPALELTIPHAITRMHTLCLDALHPHVAAVEALHINRRVRAMRSNPYRQLLLSTACMDVLPVDSAALGVAQGTGPARAEAHPPSLAPLSSPLPRAAAANHTRAHIVPSLATLLVAPALSSPSIPSHALAPYTHVTSPSVPTTIAAHPPYPQRPECRLALAYTAKQGLLVSSHAHATPPHTSHTHPLARLRRAHTLTPSSSMVLGASADTPAPDDASAVASPPRTAAQLGARGSASTTFTLTRHSFAALPSMGHASVSATALLPGSQSGVDLTEGHASLGGGMGLGVSGAYSPAFTASAQLISPSSSLPSLRSLRSLEGSPSPSSASLPTHSHPPSAPCPCARVVCVCADISVTHFPASHAYLLNTHTQTHSHALPSSSSSAASSSSSSSYAAQYHSSLARLSLLSLSLPPATIAALLYTAGSSVPWAPRALHDDLAARRCLLRLCDVAQYTADLAAPTQAQAALSSSPLAELQHPGVAAAPCLPAPTLRPAVACSVDAYTHAPPLLHSHLSSLLPHTQPCLACPAAHYTATLLTSIHYPATHPHTITHRQLARRARFARRPRVLSRLHTWASDACDCATHAHGSSLSNCTYASTTAATDLAEPRLLMLSLLARPLASIPLLPPLPPAALPSVAAALLSVLTHGTAALSHAVHDTLTHFAQTHHCTHSLANTANTVSTPASTFSPRAPLAYALTQWLRAAAHTHLAPPLLTRAAIALHARKTAPQPNPALAAARATFTSNNANINSIVTADPLACLSSSLAATIARRASVSSQSLAPSPRSLLAALAPILRAANALFLARHERADAPADASVSTTLAFARLRPVPPPLESLRLLASSVLPLACAHAHITNAHAHAQGLPHASLSLFALPRAPHTHTHAQALTHAHGQGLPPSPSHLLLSPEAAHEDILASAHTPAALHASSTAEAHTSLPATLPYVLLPADAPSGPSSLSSASSASLAAASNTDSARHAHAHHALFPALSPFLTSRGHTLPLLLTSPIPLPLDALAHTALAHTAYLHSTPTTAAPPLLPPLAPEAYTPLYSPGSSFSANSHSLASSSPDASVAVCASPARLPCLFLHPLPVSSVLLFTSAGLPSPYASTSHTHLSLSLATLPSLTHTLHTYTHAPLSILPVSPFASPLSPSSLAALIATLPASTSASLLARLASSSRLTLHRFLAHVDAAITTTPMPTPNATAGNGDNTSTMTHAMHSTPVSSSDSASTADIAVNDTSPRSIDATPPHTSSSLSPVPLHCGCVSSPCPHMHSAALASLHTLSLTSQYTLFAPPLLALRRTLPLSRLAALHATLAAAHTATQLAGASERVAVHAASTDAPEAASPDDAVLQYILRCARAASMAGLNRRLCEYVAQREVEGENNAETGHDEVTSECDRGGGMASGRDSGSVAAGPRLMTQAEGDNTHGPSAALTALSSLLHARTRRFPAALAALATLLGPAPTPPQAPPPALLALPLAHTVSAAALLPCLATAAAHRAAAVRLACVWLLRLLVCFAQARRECHQHLQELPLIVQRQIDDRRGAAEVSEKPAPESNLSRSQDVGSHASPLSSPPSLVAVLSRALSLGMHAHVFALARRALLALQAAELPAQPMHLGARAPLVDRHTRTTVVLPHTPRTPMTTPHTLPHAGTATHAAALGSEGSTPHAPTRLPAALLLPVPAAQRLRLACLHAMQAHGHVARTHAPVSLPTQPHTRHTSRAATPALPTAAITSARLATAESVSPRLHATSSSLSVLAAAPAASSWPSTPSHGSSTHTHAHTEAAAAALAPLASLLVHAFTRLLGAHSTSTTSTSTTSTLSMPSPLPPPPSARARAAALGAQLLPRLTDPPADTHTHTRTANAPSHSGADISALLRTMLHSSWLEQRLAAAEAGLGDDEDTDTDTDAEIAAGAGADEHEAKHGGDASGGEHTLTVEATTAEVAQARTDANTPTTTIATAGAGISVAPVAPGSALALYLGPDAEEEAETADDFFACNAPRCSACACAECRWGSDGAQTITYEGLLQISQESRASASADLVVECEDASLAPLTATHTPTPAPTYPAPLAWSLAHALLGAVTNAPLPAQPSPSFPLAPTPASLPLAVMLAPAPLPSPTLLALTAPAPSLLRAAVAALAAVEAVAAGADACPPQTQPASLLASLAPQLHRLLATYRDAPSLAVHRHAMASPAHAHVPVRHSLAPPLSIAPLPLLTLYTVRTAISHLLLARIGPASHPPLHLRLSSLLNTLAPTLAHTDVPAHTHSTSPSHTLSSARSDPGAFSSPLTTDTLACPSCPFPLPLSALARLGPDPLAPLPAWHTHLLLSPSTAALLSSSLVNVFLASFFTLARTTAAAAARTTLALVAHAPGPAPTYLPWAQLVAILSSLRSFCPLLSPHTRARPATGAQDWLSRALAHPLYSLTHTRTHTRAHGHALAPAPRYALLNNRLALDGVLSVLATAATTTAHTARRASASLYPREDSTPAHVHAHAHAHADISPDRLTVVLPTRTPSPFALPHASPPPQLPCSTPTTGPVAHTPLAKIIAHLANTATLLPAPLARAFPTPNAVHYVLPRARMQALVTLFLDAIADAACVHPIAATQALGAVMQALAHAAHALPPYAYMRAATSAHACVDVVARSPRASPQPASASVSALSVHNDEVHLPGDQHALTTPAHLPPQVQVRWRAQPCRVRALLVLLAQALPTPTHTPLRSAACALPSLAQRALMVRVPPAAVRQLRHSTPDGVEYATTSRMAATRAPGTRSSQSVLLRAPPVTTLPDPLLPLASVLVSHLHTTHTRTEMLLLSRVARLKHTNYSLLARAFYEQLSQPLALPSTRRMCRAALHGVATLARADHQWARLEAARVWVQWHCRAQRQSAASAKALDVLGLIDALRTLSSAHSLHSDTRGNSGVALETDVSTDRLDEDRMVAPEQYPPFSDTFGIAESLLKSPGVPAAPLLCLPPPRATDSASAPSLRALWRKLLAPGTHPASPAGTAADLSRRLRALTPWLLARATDPRARAHRLTTHLQRAAADAHMLLLRRTDAYIRARAVLARTLHEWMHTNAVVDARAREVQGMGELVRASRVMAGYDVREIDRQITLIAREQERRGVRGDAEVMQAVLAQMRLQGARSIGVSRAGTRETRGHTASSDSDGPSTRGSLRGCADSTASGTAGVLPPLIGEYSHAQPQLLSLRGHGAAAHDSDGRSLSISASHATSIARSHTQPPMRLTTGLVAVLGLTRGLPPPHAHTPIQEADTGLTTTTTHATTTSVQVPAILSQPVATGSRVGAVGTVPISVATLRTPPPRKATVRAADVYLATNANADSDVGGGTGVWSGPILCDTATITRTHTRTVCIDRARVPQVSIPSRHIAGVPNGVTTGARTSAPAMPFVLSGNVVGSRQIRTTPNVAPTYAHSVESEALNRTSPQFADARVSDSSTRGSTSDVKLGILGKEVSQALLQLNRTGPQGTSSTTNLPTIKRGNKHRGGKK